MINLNFDVSGGKAVKQLLEELPEKFRARVLKNALNNTASQALKAIYKDTQRIYDVKAREFRSTKNKKINIYRATNNRLNAVINIRSRASELIDFKVSPAKGDPKNPPNVLTGHIVRANAMKKLFHGRSDNGKSNKAFFVKFRSGHATVASRVGSKRLPIAPLWTLSISQMIGAKRMLEIIYPSINTILEEQVRKQIGKLKAKGDL